ncbi:MAG: glycosyltransferase family 10 [bacterium]|nr:glycosyltransferase family 10 [bacterium]
MKKYVIIDTDVPHEQNNRFFAPEVIEKNRFLWPWRHLYEACHKKNIELVTADVYFRMKSRPSRPIFISVHRFSKVTPRLIKSGARPAVIFGFENPLFANRFYLNLKKYTRRFDHAFVWRGAKNRLSLKTAFHDAAFRPHAYPQKKVESNFKNKKFLTLINRNNRLHKLRKLYTFSASLINPLPGLSQRELYLDRLEAIKYFSQNPNFDLYGESWGSPVRYDNQKFAPSIKKSYRGYVSDKLETLKQYRFSICFENAVFPGFITEKIIDSIYAGCIPVYYGAPDIADYIPENTFINFRKFENYPALDHYLRSMSESEYNQYIENINAFITSDKAYNFTQEKFTEELIKIFESYS